LSEQEALTTGIKMTKYESPWKEAVYYIDTKKTMTSDFIPLFEKAYNKLTGD